MWSLSRTKELHYSLRVIAAGVSTTETRTDVEWSGEAKSRSRQCSNSALRDLIKCRRWITTTHMGLAEGEHERYIERDTGVRLQCPCAGEAI